MDSRRAREILRHFRPGVDGDGAELDEALAQAQRDPDLRDWLAREGEIHRALQRKLRTVEPPPELFGQILQRQRALRPSPARRLLDFARLAAVVLVLCGVAYYWLRPAPQNSFGAYEDYLGRLVAHPYRMSLETANLDKIRSFLGNNQAPADYVLHPGLERARALGCATLSWNGNPVSMLCFSAPREDRKIFLFVLDRGAIPDSPGGSRPAIRQSGAFALAGWTEGGRSYVLVAQGDAGALREYL